MGVAYRMLGTVQDAEDAVQETYLRYSGATETDIRHLRAWLTRAIVRICLDELGSARARRERYVGPWLPEPIVGGGRSMASVPMGPEDRVTLDESVSIAMLALLESLGPAERSALMLRDVLGLPYDEVSEVLGRSQAACRQLVTRARTHIRAHAHRTEPSTPKPSERSWRRALMAAWMNSYASSIRTSSCVRTAADWFRAWHSAPSSALITWHGCCLASRRNTPRHRGLTPSKARPVWCSKPTAGSWG